MPACHAGGHGFESRTHRKSLPMEGFLLIVRTTLTHVTFTVRVLSVATLESAFGDYESRTHRKKRDPKGLSFAFVRSVFYSFSA